MEFRPLSQRANWAVIARRGGGPGCRRRLGRLGPHDLLGRLVNDGSDTIAEAATSDNRQSTIALLQIGALVFGAVFFTRW